MQSEQVLAIGAEFNGLQELKTACQETALRGFFEFDTIKSDAKVRYTIKCNKASTTGCPWRLHASPMTNTRTFVIRIFNSQHTCYGVTGGGHKQATASLIASKLTEKLREQPNYRPCDIVGDMRCDEKVHISASMALRAKELAFSRNNGTFEEGYRALP
jgi:zinc finger SWIM domain-containing protein 3